MTTPSEPTLAGAASARPLVIGTRGSALARWQAEHIAARLRGASPGLEVRLEIIVTEGDRRQQGPVADAGGKAVWVKEIEDALLGGTVDLAVHSLKDVPADLAAGLLLAAHPERADPRDALVSRDGAALDALPAGARVGTSSLRRVALGRALRPDLRFELLRGNVDTRLRRVAEGAVDAAILACAGLDRLGHGARISERLDAERFLPALGQGVLGLEARAGDARTIALCRALADPSTETAVEAERALLAALGGGCRTPLAGHAQVVGGRLALRAFVGRPDASEMLFESATGAPTEAAALGREVAARLRARGADRILAELG